MGHALDASRHALRHQSARPQGELAVGELEAQLNIRQPALPQQLAMLREKGLVSARRDGKNIFYTVASAQALAVMAVLYQQFCTDTRDDPAR
ncbi:ArsR family transcriptional regulator [Paraburkholderia ferrariae]|uniref:ArsR family transcriptional regulator n=1 Tax=Paraburkholderia ferrariae TaxID=386056 RepID=A0ABU9RPE0_9BURK